eukprot:TRINITY_DN22828_c0_g4_i1.p1 TRINITY_DN22828_c0_g4~~TRINITY_DN22828_c0_g4_i1.p1  ORF type:complete len:820 (-),score=222.43 TRINITY_DN22828_c0_g4_i1:116-2494(-)
MIQKRISKLGLEKKRRSTGGYPEVGEATDELDSSGSTTASSRVTPVEQQFAAEGDDGKVVPVSVVVRCRPANDTEQPLIGFQTENVKGKVSLQLKDLEERQTLDTRQPLDKSKANSRNFRCNAFLGPKSTQEEVFQQAAPMVEHVMNGCNATMFCYGVTGSGKTFTMSGPTGQESGLESPEAGIAQRTATKIFEYIRDASTRGMTFSVEASFLEIYSSDGKREQLIDLLTKEDKKLEVKMDPNNPESFFCEGLTTQPIRTPDELCNLLNRGRQRCTFMETTKNVASSRSHCIFMLTVECMIEPPDGEPIVQRGKLMLVDLAGSESLKKVEAADAAQESLRRQQAIGINRVLSSLGTVVNNMNKGMAGGHRDSVLTMLLHDCLGGNARALLVANIAPERDNSAEVLKTLTFSQQMTAVRSTVTVNRISKEQSSIMQIRQRHLELLRVMEQEPHEEKEQEKLRKEVEDMGNRLLTRESAEKTLEGMQREHTQKIEELKVQMAESMSKELAELRRQSLGDMEELRQSISSHMTGVGSAQLQKQSEEHEAKITKIAAEHEETRRLHRDAEQEANTLKVKLAAAEERAQMLQARLDEFMKERTDNDEDRRSMRQQSEQQWQRVATAEAELQKYKAENASQAADLQRLHAARKEDAEAAKRDREAAQAREAELQRKNNELWQQISDEKREREIAALKLEAEKKEAITKLEMQIERLNMEVEARKEQTAQIQQIKNALEEELEDVQRERDDTIRQLQDDLSQVHEDLEEVNAEKSELLHMLDEMQNSVISRRTSVGGSR